MVSFDCAAINILDELYLPVSVTDYTSGQVRTFSSVTRWIVRSVDPAQDILELEEWRGVGVAVSGVMVQQTLAGGSGVMSQPTIDGESGIMVNPTDVIGVQ